MARVEVDVSTWRALAHEPLSLGNDGGPERAVVVVTVDAADGREPAGALPAPSAVGPVVIAVAPTARVIPDDLAASADVVCVGRPDGAAEDVVVAGDPLVAGRAVAASVAANPVAATTLTWLLRARAWREVAGGLATESAAYSMLLASEEVRRWRAGHPAGSRPSQVPRVRCERHGDVLRITLTNPDRRNAMDARLRDELVAALQPAVWDRTLSVVIDAEGPTFGSGGDLAEFLSTDDVARAHLIRSTASVGRMLDVLGDRVEARVHGACIGAGVEVPLFARRVVASPATTFRLPEISMGLIPGAGGTVSVTRRIGRRRAAWWMLTGTTIDAGTAFSWGLVDALE